jgi:MFS family permease
MTSPHTPGQIDIPNRPHVPSLWRNRDFLLLWLGQSLSSVGGEATTLALPLLALALTGSPVQAGLVVALNKLASLLLLLPSGALIDRMDRKRLMLGCDAIRAVAVASIPAALLLGHLTILQLNVFALVTGACAAGFSTANIACLPRVVPPEQLSDAVARREASEGVVTLLGPPLGGALYAAARALPFVADAISYVASLSGLALIQTPFQGDRRAARRSLAHELHEGLAWVWRQRLVRFMAGVYGGFGLLFSGTPLCVIVLAQRRGASPAMIGAIFGLGGVGGVLGALIAPSVRRRVPFGRLIPLLHWGYAVLWPLYALVPTPLLMGLVEAATLTNDQVYDVTWPSYRMALIPDVLQGRVTSALRLASSITQPIGLLLTGVLIQRIGPAATLYLTSGGIALLALAVTLSPVVRTAPDHPSRP